MGGNSLQGSPGEKPDVSSLIGELRGSGEGSRVAMMKLFQLERHEILRREIPGLLERDDPEKKIAIFDLFLAYGDRLETHFPDWHKLVRRAVNPGSSKELILRAIQLAEFWKEHRMMPLLVRFAVHPFFRVRKAAFRAMGEMGDDLIIPALLSLLTSDTPVERIYGLEGAVYYEDNRIMPFAIKLLDDPVASVRLFAVRRLSDQKSAAGIAHLIARNYRSDENPEVRRIVIEMIRKHSWSRLSYLLHRAVQDPDPGVRREALLGIRDMGEWKAAPLVSRALVVENRTDLKLLGLDVLIRLGRSGVSDGVEHLLRRDPEEKVRLQAAIAAGEIRDRNLRSALESSVKDDPSGIVRLEAAGALGFSGDGGSLPILETVARDRNEIYEVRSAALASYRQISGQGISFDPSVDPLEEALASSLAGLSGSGEVAR